MPRLCSVCTHPEREAIDLALTLHAESYPKIANRFGVDWQAVYRHEREHLKSSLRRVQEEQRMSIADYVLREMRDLNERTKRALDHSAALGDDRGVFYGADVAGRNHARLWAMGADAEARERARAVEVERQQQTINQETGYAPEEMREILTILAESGAANRPPPTLAAAPVQQAENSSQHTDTDNDEETEGTTNECA